MSVKTIIFQIQINPIRQPERHFTFQVTKHSIFVANRPNFMNVDWGKNKSAYSCSRRRKRFVAMHVDRRRHSCTSAEPHFWNGSLSAALIHSLPPCIIAHVGRMLPRVARELSLLWRVLPWFINKSEIILLRSEKYDECSPTRLCLLTNHCHAIL